VYVKEFFQVTNTADIKIKRNQKLLVQSQLKPYGGPVVLFMNSSK